MVKLYSETFGQGPDIILLHGWGFNSRIWQFLTPKMAKDFRVTLIDLPGFGRSEMLDDYSLDNIVQQLLPIVPTQGIWMGWSLGGLIATKLALCYPQRVTKLICVASTPKFLKTPSWPGVEPLVLQNFSEQLGVNYEETLIRFIKLQFFGIKVGKMKFQSLDLNLLLAQKPNLDALIAGLKILEQADLRDHLMNVKCPLLYILGKRDTLVPATLATAMLKLGANIKVLVIPGAGHAPFLSHEDEFLSAVRCFSYA